MFKSQPGTNYLHSRPNLSVPDFERLIGHNHNAYLGERKYHGDRTSTPQHYTLLHAIIESGNTIILKHYLELYGKELATLDDNHGHMPLEYLIDTNLDAKTVLIMAKVLHETNSSIINMRTSKGFGLPLDTLICKMCHHIPEYWNGIDFRSREFPHLPRRQQQSIRRFLRTHARKCFLSCPLQRGSERLKTNILKVLSQKMCRCLQGERLTLNPFVQKGLIYRWHFFRLATSSTNLENIFYPSFFFLPFCLKCKQEDGRGAQGYQSSTCNCFWRAEFDFSCDFFGFFTSLAFHVGAVER